MSTIMEEMCNEAAYFNSVEIAKRMIARKRATLEEIAEDTGLTLEQIKELTVTKEVEVAR